MFPLMRWIPTRETTTFQREMDELFNKFFGRVERYLPTAYAADVPAIDCVREGDRLMIKAALPGVDPKDIELNVTGNILTIKGHRTHETEVKEEEYYVKEIGEGTFERTLTLPLDIDTEKIKATYTHGVLEVTLPAMEAVKVKKIEVTTVEEGRLTPEEKPPELKAA